MAHLLSTLTSSFLFIEYGPSVNGQFPPVLRTIRVRGGANTPGSNGFGEMSKDQRGTPIWTPRGMVTAVDDDDMKFLVNDPTFQDFVNKGLIQVLTKTGGKEFQHNHKKLVREVEDNMASGDSHRPLTAQNDTRISSKLKVSSGSNGDVADNDHLI